MFQKSSTAFRLFPFFNLIFFYIVPSIIVTVDIDGFESVYVLPMVSPFIALSNSFFTPEINQYMPNDNYSLDYILVAFVIQAFVFLGGTLAI